MLIRVLLMVEPAPLRRRIQRQVRDPHTLVSALGSRKAFWSEMSRHTFDLLILNRAALPGSGRRPHRDGPRLARGTGGGGAL